IDTSTRSRATSFDVETNKLNQPNKVVNNNNYTAGGKSTNLFPPVHQVDLNSNSSTSDYPTTILGGVELASNKTPSPAPMKPASPATGIRGAGPPFLELPPVVVVAPSVGIRQNYNYAKLDVTGEQQERRNYLARLQMLVQEEEEAEDDDPEGRDQVNWMKNNEVKNWMKQPQQEQCGGANYQRPLSPVPNNSTRLPPVE
ncbi:unnamed protein product, partial [Amoebophrya sp. A25]